MLTLLREKHYSIYIAMPHHSKIVHHQHKKGQAKSKPTGKMKFSNLLLAILLILVAGLTYYLYTYTKGGARTTSISITTPKPTTPPGLVKAPTPYLVLPQGRQEFNIQSGSGDIPIGKKIVADPLDSPKGSKQTVSIELEYNKPIAGVTVTVDTDNGSKTYDMALVSGDNKIGTWVATWTMEDSHEKNFMMTFSISYSGKTRQIPFPIR